MRLSISNIAWNTDQDQDVVELLHRFEIDAIDVAHSKYFKSPQNVTVKEIQEVKSWWKNRGIDIIGMQALLFGTSDLNVFGSDEVQSKMLNHLTAICQIGEGLGAKKLVFGSPKNRDREGLSDAEVTSISNSFFRQLGDIANSCNVTICLEPNPKDYGANFMTTNADTLQVVKEINHPNIQMQLDTGAISMNAENPTEVVSKCAPFVGHVHASEPLLAPLNRNNSMHKNISRLLTRHLPNAIVTIEMKATNNPLQSIEDALRVAVENYRSSSMESSL